MACGELTCETRSHQICNMRGSGPTPGRVLGNSMGEGCNTATNFKEKCEPKLEFPGRWMGRWLKQGKLHGRVCIFSGATRFNNLPQQNQE